VVGFDTPLPDFTDCEFTTPEPDPDWISVVHFGGDVRALDRRMPAFVDALSDDDIDRVIEYVRTFCRARMAARRPQFSASALHRKGISGK